jgi:hypothetical protein
MAPFENLATAGMPDLEPVKAVGTYLGQLQLVGHPMSIGTIILIILVIALLGGFSGLGGGPFYGTGYYGGGGLGVVIVILLILVLLGRI